MTQREKHLWAQVEKIRHRKMGWGQMTWHSKYLRVTPNSPIFDAAVADFILACVWSADRSTG